MRCPDCGYEVPEPLSLCPRCGLNIEETQPMKRRRGRPGRRSAISEETIPLPAPAEEAPAAGPTFWQRARVILLVLVSFLCLIGIAVGVAGYSGIREGERERQERRAAIADEHYQRGLSRLDAGEYELAIAEFEYALQLDPDHPLAVQGLDEARARLAAVPTPTSQAAEDIAHELYTEGVAAYQQGDWETAARVLGQLHGFAPEYEAEAVEDMLFTSLYNHGMALLEEDRFEEGIFYLDRALAIRPLDQEALWERELAHRYMTALGYWGLDWQLCVQRFEELYALAPGYKDVFSRLYEARVVYGDLWFEQEEMCPAAAQYARALEMLNDPELQQRQAEAAEVCAVATPTPIPPITGTLPTTGTLPVPGFQVGRLAYPAYNPQTGLYDIYSLTADGRLTRVAAGADQPCWQWGSDRLIYRNRLAAGLSLIQPGGQPVTLRADATAAWPTISPDGGRYAYAAPDGAGVWHIYIAPTDGTAEPVDHAIGWGPAWGPSGLLAWTGCEEDGLTCGVFVDNLDDGQPPTRLTASKGDIGLHWAPSGDLLAYMSNHTGSWNLYLLSVTGGVQEITDDPGIEALPAWAPDGSALAFLSYQDGRWSIYLMDPNGENVRRIVDLGTDMPNWGDQRLSWAP
ncbi:MAG TPA: tetratricopeptide repeat protein [Anaerolineales bacterium]|nr:tetratricopeptide repeat protein [Anaerolineales bacterium]